MLVTIEDHIGDMGRIRYTDHTGKARERTVKLLRAYDSHSPHYPADRPRPIRMLEAEDHDRIGGSWGGLILLSMAVADVESFEVIREP
jgi:hypothetical protein